MNSIDPPIYAPLQRTFTAATGGRFRDIDRLVIIDELLTEMDDKERDAALAFIGAKYLK